MIIVDLIVLPPEAQNVVQAGIDRLDDCPILTRTKAFLVDQGTTVSLEYTFRDRQGNPVDLSPYFGSGGDTATDPSWLGRVRLRVKEVTARGSSATRNPIWEIDAVYPHDPSNGTVLAVLDPAVNDQSGVYALCWAIERTDTGIILVNNTWMSVEKSLFAADIGTVERGLGPVTIQEMRGLLRDSSATENVRLDDVEWSDDQVVQAILRPVEYWNEVPPPIEVFTTRTFPFRHHWTNAAIAEMYRMAAHWYRRNKQQISAGGLQDDDLNRDKSYAEVAERLWQEYRDFVINKKVELNARKFAGTVQSIYGSRSGYY